MSCLAFSSPHLATLQEAPLISSALELRESKKWFKKVPEPFFASSPPAGTGEVFDPYNRTRTRETAGREGLTDKVTSSPAVEVERTEQTYRPRPAAKSEIRNQTGGEEASPNYLTEEAISSAHQRLMDVPLYSSFAPDFVYRPRPLPPSRRHASRQSSPALRAHPEALASQQEEEASRGRGALQPPPRMQTILVSPKRNGDAAGADRRGSAGSSRPRASPAFRSLLDRGTQIRSSGFVG